MIERPDLVPVMQTKRGGPDLPPEERGDCMSACLATLLGVDIEHVPVPHTDDLTVHWFDVVQGALRPHGYHMVVCSTTVWPHGYWIAGVPSKNLFATETGRPLTHVVVMHDYEVVHDPSLGERYEVGTAIEDLRVRDGYVLVPFDQRTRRQPVASESACYCCDKCGQPLAYATSTCNSAVHEGPDSMRPTGRAVPIETSEQREAVERWLRYYDQTSGA